MGKIRQQLDSPFAAKIYATLFAMAASYMGYEKVEEYRAAQAPAGSQSIEVNIESVPEGLTSHSHGPVLGRTDIEVMIQKEIKAYDAQVRETYKPLEAWEK